MEGEGGGLGGGGMGLHGPTRWRMLITAFFFLTVVDDTAGRVG